jgi:hypothetical protein
MEINKEGKTKLVPLSEIEKETGAVPVTKPPRTKLPTAAQSAAAASGTGGMVVSKRPSEKS